MKGESGLDVLVRALKRGVMLLCICNALIFLTQTIFATNTDAQRENMLANQKEKVQETLERPQNQSSLENVMPGTSGKKLFERLMRGDINEVFREMTESIKSHFQKQFLLVFNMSARLVAAIILIRLLGLMKNSFVHTQIPQIAYLCGYMVLALMLNEAFGASFYMIKRVVENTQDLIYSVIPIFLVLIATSGGIVTSSILEPTLITGFGVLFVFLNRFLFPCILFQMAIALISNIQNKVNIRELGSFMKQITLWGMGVFLTIFVGVLSLQGSLGFRIDGFTTKTTKLLLVSGLPFAGKYFSDAAETIVGYSMLLKNSAGIFVLIIFIGICIIPILNLLVWSLFFKLMSVVASTFQSDGFSRLLDDVGSIFFLLLAVLCMIALMFYIAISILMGQQRFF